MRLLVVEDDPDLNRQLTTALTDAGYVVDRAFDGEEGHFLGDSEPYDAVVLDIGLPKMDGISVLEAWRRNKRVMPVLILTARDRWSDKVQGFDAGADDYVAKPFHLEEILARIRALLRRARAQATVADEISKVRAFRFGKWELNVGLRKLKSPEGKAVALTNGEFSLLTAFLSSPNRVLTRDQLLDLSRLHNAEVYDRSIDVQILRLRRKIEPDPAHPKFIVTERGAGYVFASEVTPVR